MARSGLEKRLDREIEASGLIAFYEPVRIPYTIDAAYVPDYILPNGIVVEAKGHFTSADRRKMRAVKAQYPRLDIRLVFGRAANKLNRTSRTSYADWAESKEFPWANKSIPPEWWEEPMNKASWAILVELGMEVQ
jgi:hypothetical protein